MRREIHLHVIRRDIAAALRTTPGVGEPAPTGLLAMLAGLERRPCDGEWERLFAEVDRPIDALLPAARAIHGGDRVSP